LLVVVEGAAEVSNALQMDERRSWLTERKRRGRQKQQQQQR